MGGKGGRQKREEKGGEVWVKEKKATDEVVIVAAVDCFRRHHPLSPGTLDAPLFDFAVLKALFSLSLERPAKASNWKRPVSVGAKLRKDRVGKSGAAATARIEPMPSKHISKRKSSKALSVSQVLPSNRQRDTLISVAV